MATRGRRNRAWPEVPESKLFSVPNTGMLTTRDLVDLLGGAARAAKVLRVTRELVDLWQSGQVETPWTVTLALWWQGPYGFNQAFSESSWTHSYNSFLKNEARARVEVLEAYILAHALPVPPGRLTTHKEMLLAGPQHPTSSMLRRLGEADLASSVKPSLETDRTRREANSLAP